MKSLLSLILILGSSIVFGQNADEIIRQAENRLRGESSIAEMQITTIRPRWQREMKVKTWTKGDDYSVTLVQSPAKDKGTVFLKRKQEIWHYMPAIERTIKMPPSMLSQSWMGTDMTNDDLVKESSLEKDYDKTILGESTLLGYPCYKIKLTPKAGKASIWGQIIIWISKAEFMQLKTEFYDEDLTLINTIAAQKVGQMGGKLMPTVVDIIPANKKGHKTRMSYISLLFNTPIDDQIFTTQYMKRLK